MLISNKGAGMFGHQDVLRTSSWQVQLRGAKKWFICAPDQKPYLYHAGNVRTIIIIFFFFLSLIITLMLV